MKSLDETLNARNADEMADCLDALRADLRTNPTAWENATLERYLEALATVFRDHQGALLKGHEVGEIPYDVLAKLLQAASVYE